MIKNSYRIIINLCFLITLSISLISASGVAVPYWNENPLRLAPGETTIIQLTLQNKVGNDDVTFEATISGEGVTILDGSIYFIPLGAEIPVNLKIDVPKDADIGENYNIAISFKEIPKEGEGMLRVTGAVTARFPVEVVGEEKSLLYGKKSEFSFNIWIFIILGLMILIGVFFIAKKKKASVSK